MHIQVKVQREQQCCVIDTACV